ncbi:McrC family protein [Photobacterium kagoshimensis]|uniref:McrC family protein n=1 Tax=Photobacterium kagoshimensis TaxID=2910242 RepID=UPI003D10A9BB
MRNSTINLFEYDCISCDEAAKTHAWVVHIPKACFEYLKRLCLGEGEERLLLSLRRCDGMEVLQVQNYAGVIVTPDGTQIEVLPKVGRAADDRDQGIVCARNSLLTMLRALRGYQHIQTSTASIKSEKMPLLEVFISQFLGSVNTLVKRGLRSDYFSRQDNLTYAKGKLLVAKQIRHNLVNKHKFFCEYDEFVKDRPANRLVHAALAKVSKYTRSAANQKLLAELEFVFADIPKSRDSKRDFNKLKLDRGMEHYKTPLKWCELILSGLSPQSMSGKHSAVSLLFPMERLFEDYVAHVLTKQLAQTHRHLQVTAQAKGKHLAVYQGKGHFALRPDLLIKHGEQNLCVLDTKWKMLDSEVYNQNIAQGDVYQMFAYAKKYLNSGVGKDVILIYPQQANFMTPLESCFDLDDGHRLWVVPFVIASNNDSRLLLPDECKPWLHE